MNTAIFFNSFAKRFLLSCVFMYCSFAILQAQEINSQDSVAQVIPEGSSAEINEENLPIGEENLQILQTDENTPIQAIGVWDTVRVFLVLGIIIVCIYLFVWGLKKVQRKSYVNSEIIGLVSSRVLTGGGNIHLIKMGKSFFLIGATSQGVNLIKEINKKEEVDEVELQLSSSESVIHPNASFWEKIKKTTLGIDLKGQNQTDKNTGKTSTVHDLQYAKTETNLFSNMRQNEQPSVFSVIKKLFSSKVLHTSMVNLPSKKNGRQSQ